MKILVVSDRISPFLYREEIRTICKGVEIVFSCGDLPFYYLEFIVTMLNKPLYYVFGNHDTYLVRSDNKVQTEPAGCINLDQKIFFENELLIGGLEGSMRYNKKNHQYTEHQMYRKMTYLKPRLLWNRWRHGRNLDILITHAPPFGIHDGTDICHQGFKSFIYFMREFKPRYLIHGHTHANIFSSKPEIFEETQIINVYGYKIIEII
jgi:Icc-related predicted phosphoesterase